MIVCSKCGFENEDSDSFCGSCASFLEWDGKRVEAEPEPVPEPAPEPEPPVETRQGLIGRVKEAIGFTDLAPGVVAGDPAGAPLGVAPDPAADGSSGETSEGPSAADLGPVSAPLVRTGYPDVGEAPPPPPLIGATVPADGSALSPADSDREAAAPVDADHEAPSDRHEPAGLVAQPAGLVAQPPGLAGDPGAVRHPGEPADKPGPMSADSDATISGPAPVVPGPATPAAVRPGSVRPAPASPPPGVSSQAGPVRPDLTSRPVATSSDVADSVAASAAIAQPGATTPGGVQPGTVQPGALQPGAVQPGAVKPGASPTRKPAQKKPAATPDINPGDKICGQCGFGNDPTRRFCRHCAASLAEANVYTMSWYRRLWRRLTVRRHHAAGERPKTRRRAIGGSGPGWLTSWVTRVVTLAVAAVVILSFVGPWHTSLHAREMRYYHDVVNTIHPTYNPLHPVSATASSSAPGHPASNLIDGAINTSWQSNATTTSQTITLQLPAPSDIAKIGFLNGDQDLPQDFVTEPRPQQLSIVFNGPKAMSKTVTLSDTPNFQSFSVSTKSTTSITISILSVYPATGTGKNVSIAEIELFTKS